MRQIYAIPEMKTLTNKNSSSAPPCLNAGRSGRTVPGDIRELAEDGLGLALRYLLTVEDDEVPAVGVGVEQGAHAPRGDPLAAGQVHAVQALALFAQQLQGFVRYLMGGETSAINQTLAAYFNHLQPLAT
jgi:hypothetical protein